MPGISKQSTLGKGPRRVTDRFRRSDQLLGPSANLGSGSGRILSQRARADEKAHGLVESTSLFLASLFLVLLDVWD